MKAALLWVKFEKTAKNRLQLSNILTNLVKHLIANPAIYTANSYKYHFVKSSRLIQRPYLKFVYKNFCKNCHVHEFKKKLINFQKANNIFFILCHI